MQVRQASLSPVQLEKEDWMQYLDDLEGLRSQGFPQESKTSQRYEILHRLMGGVRDPVLRRKLAIVNASESFLADPSTVESLRFDGRQLQRNCPKGTTATTQPSAGSALKSRPHSLFPMNNPTKW